MLMLGGGCDSRVRAVGRGFGGWLRPEPAGRSEQEAAQVLQQAQAVGGHGQAAPAAGGPVQHGPDQGQAAGLTGSRPMTLTLLRVSPKVRSMKLA